MSKPVRIRARRPRSTGTRQGAHFEALFDYCRHSPDRGRHCRGDGAHEAPSAEEGSRGSRPPRRGARAREHDGQLRSDEPGHGAASDRDGAECGGVRHRDEHFAEIHRRRRVRCRRSPVAHRPDQLPGGGRPGGSARQAATDRVRRRQQAPGAGVPGRGRAGVGGRRPGDGKGRARARTPQPRAHLHSPAVPGHRARERGRSRPVRQPGNATRRRVCHGLRRSPAAAHRPRPGLRQFAERHGNRAVRQQ